MKTIYLALLVLFMGFADTSPLNVKLDFLRDTRRSHKSLGIIDGKNASITKFPFMASFTLLNTTLWGSGVVLNKHWILTTAANVAWVPVDMINFRVGSNRYDSGGQLLGVEKTIYHPKYTGTYDYNIAVVKVTQPIKLSKSVKAAKLGTKNLKSKTKVNVAGWGETAISGNASTILTYADVTILSSSSCNSSYYYTLTSRVMCTDNENKGACIYDYGDPLIYKNAVYGLYGGGMSYDCLEYPAVYTDVPSLYKWVKSSIK